MLFEHYLSAWAYARKHRIRRQPKRVSFTSWSL